MTRGASDACSASKSNGTPGWAQGQFDLRNEMDAWIKFSTHWQWETPWYGIDGTGNGTHRLMHLYRASEAFWATGR